MPSQVYRAARTRRSTEASTPPGTRPDSRPSPRAVGNGHAQIPKRPQGQRPPDANRLDRLHMSGSPAAHARATPPGCWPRARRALERGFWSRTGRPPILPAVPGRVLINGISLWEGGSSRNYYTNILRELDYDPRGFEFTVIAPRGQLSESERGRHHLIEVDLPRNFRTLARVIYEEALLPIRIRNFDLLYCPADLLPAWSPRPCVVALRNLNIYDRRFCDTPRTRALNRLVRLGVRGARAIITPSEAAARGISALLRVPLDRFHVVPHGISPAAFEANVAPAASARPFLFYPANLERHKNFELVFESLRRLSNPDVEFWIAGSDRQEPEYANELRRRTQELGIAHRVRFLGHVPYRHILSYYRGAAALVFPSRLETFGHPMLEAMLAETPIVSCDLPVFHELADGVALFAPHDDPAQFASAIEKTLSDVAATRVRVKEGRHRAQEFTWSHSVDRLCEVFEGAMTPVDSLSSDSAPAGRGSR